MNTELPVEPAQPVLEPLPAPEARPATSRWTWAMWIVALLGTALRLWFVLTVHRPIDFDYSDMHSYIERATQMATPTYHSSPWDWYYPSGTAFMISLWLRLLGPHEGFTAAAIWQALLSGAEIPLIYLATRRFFSRPVAFGAAALWATHYLSIGYAGFFMSENYLTIGLVVACALLLPERPRHLLAAGLALGVGAWAKSQAFLLAPLWAALLFWRGKRAGAGLLVAGALAVVVPVSVVCSIWSGHKTFISLNGGQTFALGQCPIRDISYNDPVSRSGAGFSLPVQNQRFERGDPEASWDSAHYTEQFVNSGYYMREGFKCIQRYPMHALRMVFYHLADTFCGPPWSITMPWPDSHTRFRNFSMGSNLFVSLLIAPLAFLGLWWRRREDAMWLLFGLPVLSVFASAVLFHGDSRFRMPYDFFFFIAACAAVEHLWTKRRGLGTESAPLSEAAATGSSPDTAPMASAPAP